MKEVGVVSRRLLWGTTTAVSLAFTGVLLLPSGGSLAEPGKAGEHLSNRCEEKHPDWGRDGEVGHHNPVCSRSPKSSVKNHRGLILEQRRVVPKATQAGRGECA